MEHDGENDWFFVTDAPRSRWTAELVGGGAPFDVVESGGRLIGWFGGADHRFCDSGCLYHYDDGVFTLMPQRENYVIRDLQLLDERFGWAVGYRGAGRSIEQVLLRLENREWRVVPSAGLGVRSVAWSRMAAVSPSEVWLLGTGRQPTTGVTRQSLFRFNGRWSVYGDSQDTAGEWSRCDAEGIAAARTRDGGTTVWMVGASLPCGPSEVDAAGSSAQPVSRLDIRPIRTQLFLPYATP
jgi:hypothetical protein